MTTTNVASRTYSPGVQRTFGPQTPQAGNHYDGEFEPTQPLPAGVSLSYDMEISRDGGATYDWHIAGPNTVVGPAAPADMDIGVGLNVPVGADWRFRVLWSLSGGSWTTGWTITEVASPLPA